MLIFEGTSCSRGSRKCKYFAMGFVEVVGQDLWVPYGLRMYGT